jgi:arabinan endo-1,5-alpha-L-arabinosidase
MAVQGVPVGAPAGRGDTPPPPSIPGQDAAQVGSNWPGGPVDARMAPYMLQAQQKWAITPVDNAGGYPGSPYFKITIAGTDRALAATADAELTVLPAFTGGPEQLWRIDQLTDGSYRLMPKRVPNTTESPAVSAIGSSMPTLETFKPASDRQRWLLRTP